MENDLQDQIRERAEEEELVKSMIIFLGMMLAIGTMALAAFLVPEEQEFLQMGFSPTKRYH